MEPVISLGSQPVTVLVVDDSIAHLRLLSNLLREYGITPRPVTSGELALATAKVDPPDLILLDIDLPGMSGFEVCRALKQDEALKAVPVIFISGMADSSGIVKALALGGVDFVTKPFQAEEVGARVMTHLRLLHLQRQLEAQNASLERQVAERTMELAQANARLQELNRVKTEFLGMLSHEIRTPASGLFGICDLLVRSASDNDKPAEYAKYYELSKARLMGLIEDATLIAQLSATPAIGEETTNPLCIVLSELRTHLQGIALEVEGEDEFEFIPLRDEMGLLARSLRTAVLLARCFSRDKNRIRIHLDHDRTYVTLRINLDAFMHSTEEAEGFFRLESKTRSASYAEPLGLAPVVAHRILSALGGNLQFIKDGATGDALEVVLALGGHH